MMKLPEPNCLRCNCPLIHFEQDQHHRMLCLRCHAEMVARSQRNKKACGLGDIESCKVCRNREYKFSHTLRNRDTAAEYYSDYYYRNWEVMRAKRNAWARARYARQKAQREPPNDLL